MLILLQRVAIATTVAGVVAYLLGVHHVYWTVAFATLVLHQGGTRSAQMDRAAHRVVGTAIGLGVFALLHLTNPRSWALVAVIFLLQFSIEMLVVRSYALAVSFITPLSLTVATAGHSQPLGALMAERGLDTLIGVAIALAVLWATGWGTAVPLLRSHARRVVVQMDRVLATIQHSKTQTAAARQERRHLYFELLEAETGWREARSNEPKACVPYAELTDTVRELGYLVLGAAWHPEFAGRPEIAEARSACAEIIGTRVRRTHPEGQFIAPLRRIETALKSLAPDDSFPEERRS